MKIKEGVEILCKALARWNKASDVSLLIASLLTWAFATLFEVLNYLKVIIKIMYITYMWVYALCICFTSEGSNRLILNIGGFRSHC